MSICKCLRCSTRVKETDDVRGWLMLRRAPNNNATPVVIVHDLHDVWGNGTFVEYYPNDYALDFELIGICPSCRLNTQPVE